MTKEQINVWQLCQELGYETPTGRINFKSPFYTIVCKKLGIKYGNLTRLGKAKLKADAIETYNSNERKQADRISGSVYN